MTSAGSGGHRPILLGVRGTDRVQVTLEHRGRQYVGELAVTADRGLAATSAAAAIAALDRLTPEAVALRLDWCGVVDPGQVAAPAVLVFATATVAGVPLLQTGSALVRKDVQLAAVRAALDAMNRRLDVMAP